MVESSTQEVVDEVVSEEKRIPTLDVMSMLGKKSPKKNKTRRKMKNMGNVEVSKTIIEVDTRHDLEEYKILGLGVEVGEHQKKMKISKCS